VRRTAWACLATAWLAACASPPPEPAWAAGRLALRVEASPQRPAQSLSAGFELRGDGQQGELRLLSPLGNQVAAARWAPGLAELTTAQGERRFADLQALSLAVLGESLPLQALPEWLAGRPWAQAEHAVLPEGFAQLGWRVDTRARAQGRIEAHRAAPPSVTLRLRLDEAPVSESGRPLPLDAKHAASRVAL